MQRRDTEHIEATLREVWSEILELPLQKIPTDRSFFALGGDSILLMRVMERVNSLFFADSPQDALAPTDFLSYGTIRQLTGRLTALAEAPLAPRSYIGRGHPGCVAVIGMGVHVPGATSSESFWRNLREGLETLRFFSAEELLEGGATPEELADPRYVRCAGLLDQIQLFDAEYFGLNSAEAVLMAPEQRLLLECAEEALQQAGYGVRWRGERVGVFAGFGLSTYLLDHFAVGSGALESTAGMRLLVGNTNPATRVSYLLNLTGPSVTLDTACSSSLVAVHQACRAVLNDECEMALAGGATVRRFAPRGYRAEKNGILSPDGHCRPFDRQAKGTVGTSGAAMVLLKRLDASIADGDSVYAVVRGTAINNDGNEKAGYTAPSRRGQAAVITAACAAAGVEPGSLQYIESHGTATELGDVIEVAALQSAFGSCQGPSRCALGTLKANLGHLEAAAGVAGLIKVVMALHHREMPPAIHFDDPNPQLDLGQTPFYLNRQLQGWPTSGTPRRAGVSSFGIGGTNAHAVLEEAPQLQQSSTNHRDSKLLILSARSPAALQTMSRQLVTHLSAQPTQCLADVAYSLQVGRAAREHRCFYVCESTAEAVRLLEADVDPGASAPPAANDIPVVFMFPGQGSQHLQMARGLYATEPVFREHIDRCAELLRPILGLDIRELIYPAAPQEDAFAGEAGIGRRLSDTILCQPVLFAVEYSLAGLWRSWGVVPSLMIGHSLGEYTAACVSGVLSLEDALLLVSARGRLMQRAPAGRMLSVALSRDDVVPLLGTVGLAAVNADKSCVVSGPTVEIERLRHYLEASGVSCSLLDTSHAFHSSAMEDIVPEFAAVFARVAQQPVGIPYVSNVTGHIFQHGTPIPPDYWLRHLRETVEFSRGIHKLMQGSAKVFMEVGPGTTLSACLRNISGSRRHMVINSCRHHRARDNDSVVLMRAVGRAWQAGVGVDWPRFNARNGARRIALPTYPFERKRHWIERVEPVAVAENANHPGNWFYVPAWKQRPVLSNDPHRKVTCCVLFDDQTAVSEALAHTLAVRSRRVVRVRIGGSYSESEHGFVLDPAEPSHYLHLTRALADQGLDAEMIVHAWQLSAAEGSLTLGFYSLLYLCQALEERRRRALPLELIVLTCEAHLVLGDERGNLMAAMLPACARVIMQEFRNVTCRCVDMSLGTNSPSRVATIADSAISEAFGDSREPLVAYRGRSCFVPTYEALAPMSDPGSSSLLRTGGAYLITGGLGGIGLTLAEFLGRAVAARIVVTARSEFPPRERWDDWLSAQGDDEVSHCIRRIRAIEGHSAKVLIIRADVTQPEQMRAAVAQTLERFGALHGVIHAAGIPGAGVIALKSFAAAQSVLAPKIRGTLVALEAVEHLDLDFFIVCSSIGSIVTLPGQFDYCAANAFLDAFAHVHDRNGRTRFISINWDGWREVGMAARAATLRTASPPDLEHALSCQDGVEVFRQVLAMPRPQWIISTRPLAARIVKTRDTSERSSAPERVPRAQRDTLTQIWCDLLGVQQPRQDDDFFALGGDSLLAIQLSAQLESRCGVSISMRQLLRAPTLAGLASLLESQAATANRQENVC